MKLPKVLTMGGTCLLALTLFGGFFAVPKLINNAIKASKGLKQGSMTRGLYEKFPYPLNFYVNIFNVTNPMEVTRGEKPIVHEVGPYCFDSYKSKVETKDRNKDDTMTFRPVSHYFFNQHKSGALTGDEIIVVPNILMIGMVVMVEREQPGMLTMINKAVKELFNKPETMYLTVKARELMFEGILINCTVKEFASKAVCTKLNEKAGTEVEKVGEKLFKFSLFGMRNGSLGGLYRVKRGIKNATDSGKVVEYNDKKMLTTWSGDHCNNITGTDGSIFGPFFTEADKPTIFAADICRSLSLDYERSTEFQGIPVFRYKGGFGDIAKTPADACFCTTNTTCPKKGSIDLTKCIGMPVILTLPHFLEAPEYDNEVTGLSPNIDNHEFFLDFEPISGNPVNVASRIQFNIEVHAVGKVDVMKDLKTTMHPILWMEEGIVIPDKFISMIRDQLLNAIWMVTVGKWFLLVVSIAMIVAGRWLKSKAKDSSELTSVQPFESPKKVMMMRDGEMMKY